MPKILLQLGQITTGKVFKYLSFRKHMENLCQNANYKVHALRCIRKYLTVKKAKLLAKLH